MQYQMSVVHAASGKQFLGELVDGDEQDLQAAQQHVKEMLKEGTVNYIHVGNVILPGPFILNECYFLFLSTV